MARLRAHDMGESVLVGMCEEAYVCGALCCHFVVMILTMTELTRLPRLSVMASLATYLGFLSLPTGSLCHTHTHTQTHTHTHGVQSDLTTPVANSRHRHVALWHCATDMLPRR